MARWMANLPSSFTAQMALMGWLVCRVSKLTGYTIPSVGLAPGGAIEESRDNIAHCLLDMEAIADALAAYNHWDRVQFAILKRMHATSSTCSMASESTGRIVIVILDLTS